MWYQNILFENNMINHAHYRSINWFIMIWIINIFVFQSLEQKKAHFYKNVLTYFSWNQITLPCSNFSPSLSASAPSSSFFVMNVYSDVWLFLVVVQRYETDVAKEYVIRGNDALMKCSIPSFVSDMVQIIAWLDSEEQIVYLNQKR